MYFCLMWFYVGSAAAMDDRETASVYQEGGFLSAETGDSVTLRCFSEGDVAVRYYWYKQTLGQKPRLISTFYKYQANATFHNEFVNDLRFTVDADKGRNHLTISDLRLTDSATYYCATGYSYKFEIAEGAVIDVKGSGSRIQAWVQQSEAGAVRPGGSVTLDCTVHAGSCDGKHGVYWFKNAGEPHPALLYTHGDGDAGCGAKPGAAARSCVYSLSVPSLNRSHAGTYYCAVAACGRIVFGKGTRLDFRHERPPSPAGEMNSSVLLCILSATVAFSTVALVFVCVLEKISGILKEFCGRTQADPSSQSVKDKINKDALRYTAGRKDQVKSWGGQTDDTWSECVYLRVK